MVRQGEHCFQLCFTHKSDKIPPPIKSAGCISNNREALTDEKIKELAKKMYKNEIFTSMQVSEYDLKLMNIIFMPLALMDEVGVKSMKVNKIAHIYSYIDDHCGRAVNGYPSFHTLYTLTSEEAEKLRKKWMEIIEVMEKL